ncbi:hypothetical protein SAMN04489832_0233 [Micromonospora cremea]|uniref:Uncharacterized protein n=1 Tax=Micromonospora cremea TaxID=709881 RepID=A0A1N5TL10_9ACTN|nr:hypothetical protein SAMN04489832_0233 [Micromonospora cremea]
MIATDEAPARKHVLSWGLTLERVTGIEPALSAWESHKIGSERGDTPVQRALRWPGLAPGDTTLWPVDGPAGPLIRGSERGGRPCRSPRRRLGAGVPGTARRCAPLGSSWGHLTPAQHHGLGSVDMGGSRSAMTWLDLHRHAGTHAQELTAIDPRLPCQRARNGHAAPLPCKDQDCCRLVGAHDPASRRSGSGPLDPGSARPASRRSAATGVCGSPARPGRGSPIRSPAVAPAGQRKADQLPGYVKATGLRWPSRSTARTPKKMLSLDRLMMVAVVTSPTGMTWVQSGEVVSRQTIS